MSFPANSTCRLIAIFLAALPGLVAPTPASAQNAEAERIFFRYFELRPTPDELPMYQLDWADSLEGATRRAASENRPIFLVIIHAEYGDIFSGHC